MSSNKPVFIVSTGRSGSNMVAKMLAEHPQLFAVHEPTPDLNAEAYASWNGSHGTDYIRKKVVSKRSDLIQQVLDNEYTYIESSHYCSHLIPLLDDLYDAKFIYLYRDGRDFVRSGLEREWWYPERSFSHPELNGLKEFFKRQVRRRWLIDVGHTWDDHRLKPPNKLNTRIEKISWLWVEINTVIQDYLLEVPSKKVFSIKLEAFDQEEIKSLLSFLDVRQDEKIREEMIRIMQIKPNKTISRSVSTFNEWPDKDKAHFWRIAKGMMDELKYI